MNENGKMDTVQLKAAQREIQRVNYRHNVEFTKLMRSVSNQPPAKHSSSSLDFHVLVGLSNSLFISLVIFFLLLTVFQEENG